MEEINKNKASKSGSVKDSEQKKKRGRPKKLSENNQLNTEKKQTQVSTKQKLEAINAKVQLEKEKLTLTKKETKGSDAENMIVAKQNNKNINAKHQKPVIKNTEQVYSDSGKQGGKAKVMKRDNTTKLLIALSLISLVLIMVVAGQFFVLENKFPSNTLSRGTTINGINVGGLSFKEAENIIATTFGNKAESFNLTIKYKDKSWSFGKEDFKVNSQIHTIIEEAAKREAIADNKELAQNTLAEFEKQGVKINVAFNYIFVGLDDKINEILKEIEIEPVNSELSFTPSGTKNFIITHDKPGLRVNKEKLYADINQQFIKTNNVEVEIETVEEVASVTYEANLAQTNLISSFKTNVADSTGARKSNVKLALEKFNGMVIMPGEEVSFNKITGPHTTENGYKVATVIYNGQFVDGVGGGICQASTTLYNALLKANVEIQSVSKHTLPVKYVPLALDAMVSEYIADLKFKNVNEYPLYIKTSSDSNSVGVEIYSHALKDGLEIKTRAEVIKTIPHLGDTIKPDTKGEYSDKVLFKGEQFRLTWPREGYEAKAYLDYYQNGKLIEEKEIRHEVYQPQAGIVIEGVEEAPAGLSAIESNIDILEPSVETNGDVYKNLQDNAIPTFLAP